MICLDVYLNGEKLCRAGRDDLSVLSATLHHSTRNALGQDIGVTVGGLVRDDSDCSTDLRWAEGHDVRVGDEISFRFVESDSADEPTHEETESREWIEQQERKYYERMKVKFEKD